MTLDEKIPIQAGNWAHLNQFLAVGHNTDGTTVGGSSADTLSTVLANGNDAGGHNITGVGDITMTGLTGATQATRYVGATATGAPVTGTFAVGDFVVARDGNIWICTGAGTPGTWVSASGVVSKGRARYGGVTQYSIPGLYGVSGVLTFAKSPNRAEYTPLFVDSTIVIDQLVCELVTGVAASNCRMALYRADTDWQPTTLVANTDTGAFATAVANQGVIPKTISDTTLAPGRYLTWMNGDSGNPTFRSMRGSNGHLLGYAIALGTSPGLANIYVSQTYGAPPGTGTAWDSVSLSTPHTADWYVFLRIKTA